MQNTQVKDVEIVGWACRLPGANSVSELWRLLREGRCAVTQIPSDRWCRERFGHPRGERGRSYTFAAGVLDDIWGFDAEAFGLSPREAEQMDPQQRLLLELTWEALEDAGIQPSSLAGSETGVFVGASTVDNGNARMFDMAGADPYFATGNAASILANRISYVYDLTGPSFTLDTACSSSLVALDAAVQSLRSGRCETAIVAGVNLLLTPFHFVAFSQAAMLSRRGLCQTFSADADGYVRAEGGAVLVLRAGASTGGRTGHARILSTRVNSDGRTNGIALPSPARQAHLLRQVYGPQGLDPEHLAFVESHGTGTPVGDPIEAQALGEVLGRRRTAALPIGSIKSNIGHTEALAGLAGVLKAALALHNDLLPASLHCETLNPRIDFEALHLRVAQEPVPLARAGAERLAGVSAYGFGGTNAHVVLADPLVAPRESQTAQPSVLLLSAHTRAALTALAHAYADRLESQPGLAPHWIAAANARRDLLPERLVAPLTAPEALLDALRGAHEMHDEGGTARLGTAVARHAPVAFVFSGNGSQWVGMGRAALGESADFRAALAEVDAHFEILAGWSLYDALKGENPAADLGRTSIAQPLIFGIQVAATQVLKRAGLRPAVVLGHSVGEVAAATVAGLVDLATAVRIIFFRSTHQERVAEKGSMAVLIGSRDRAETIMMDQEDLSIAAWNSPRAITVSGSNAALDRLAETARQGQTRLRRLDLPYPFHSALVEPIRLPLLADLGQIRTDPGHTPFISTVTGALYSGEELDADYWWRNVREPVLFSRAIEEAFRAGARVFIEIGPNPILLSHIEDTLAGESAPIATLAVLDSSGRPGDQFRRLVAAALASGAQVDSSLLFGRDPGGPVELPSYPWQRTQYRLAPTPEADGLLAPRPWHPLIGARIGAEAAEWRSVVDTVLVPSLADHVVDKHVLLPGAAFSEMALAVARDWFGTESVRISDFHIHHPLILDPPASRELRCRVEPSTGILEITSRPRLAQNGWQTHATGKIQNGAEEGGLAPCWPDSSGPPNLTGDDLYPAAAEAGLAYGPAYRLLVEARRIQPDRIVVELRSTPGGGVFNLDPAQVDACFHGLVLLYAELSDGGPANPFVPVSFSELNLYRPGTPVRRAVVDVLKMDSRAIVADLTLASDTGEIVARYRGLRFQSLNRVGLTVRRIEFFTETNRLAAEPLAGAGEPGLSAEHLVAAARATAGSRSDESPPSFDYVLLEGWATSVAFEAVRHVAVDNVVDLGRNGFEAVEERLWRWCELLLPLLAKSELAEPLGAGRYRLASNPGLPDPAEVLATLAAEYPGRSAELLLASRVTAFVAGLDHGVSFGSVRFSAPALEAFELGGQLGRDAAAWVASAMAELDEHWPKGRAVRILQVGDGPVSPLLAQAAAQRGAELTIVELDRRRLERARLAAGRQTDTAFLGDLAQLPPKAYDLVVACHTLGRMAADLAWGGAVKAALAPNAVVVVVEPEPSLFRDVVFGSPLGETAPGTRGSSGPEWQAALASLALERLVVVPAAVDRGSFICIGRATSERTPQVGRSKALVIGLGGTASALATMLRFSGLNVEAAAESEGDGPFGSECDRLVLFPGDMPWLSPAQVIEARCLELRDLSARIGSREMRLWVVCQRRTASHYADPVDAAVRAFARCLGNEVTTLDVRFVDLAPGLLDDVAARRLKDIVFSETSESDILVEALATRVKRYDRLELPAVFGSPDQVLRLVKGDGAGLDRVVWRAVERRPPAPGEVEIAIEAAGLNFRDVMWALSVLPDEILDDGYAGATLGLECAGRVVRVGAGVDRFKPGDAVIAFARAALATHATVPDGYVAHRPEQLSAEAGATIPVAFLTAYYALIERARLGAGEWVLIHGGAGGVGMAALQIARWRGARVIATAGTNERRDLLGVLGAEHVFDSRSTAFAAEVRRVTGTGVHVVLNSLSGEAMERSIDVLRPFGRFVELGKRDYVANTHIGLKPFRRNLSYFGVDLDQLMLWEEDVGRAALDMVMGLFDGGDLTALPYRTFDAPQVVEAFRLMQRSGHIGKVLVRPPNQPPAVETGVPFKVAQDRTHLVSGGLGGFGLVTARWLADHGARHLVLIGRSGASRPEAEAAVEALRSEGVSVRVARADISDEAATADLLADIAKSMPPLAGVVHAATVYADAIAANLSPNQLKAVLRAKVTGADVLDRLTRPMALDYFILYSSATTMIGNPGQGAYVAANAYLEGLAAERRSGGLPGLAVAWGAIEDAGILTRSSAAATSLLGRSGVQAMPARAALDRLHDFLSSRVGAEASTITIAAVNWSAAQTHLRALRSPTFSRLTGPLQAGDSLERTKISIRELVDEQGFDGAVDRVIETVRDEIARILRMPRDDVSPTKPLMEMGLDSLMGVELAMALEQRFVLDVQLSQSAGTMTVKQVAEYLVGSADSALSGLDEASERLALRHLGPDLRESAIVALPRVATAASPNSREAATN